MNRTLNIFAWEWVCMMELLASILLLKGGRFATQYAIFGPFQILFYQICQLLLVDMLSKRLVFKNPTNGALDPLTGIKFRISKPFKAKSIQSQPRWCFAIMVSGP